MKKAGKRMVSLCLALVFMLSAAVNAFALEDSKAVRAVGNTVDTVYSTATKAMNKVSDTPQYNMKSKYTDKVGNTPRSEYPRPQLERDSYMTLNGKWDYAIIPSTQKLTKYDGEILVPFAPESLLSGVEKVVMPTDTLYYKRTFKVAKKFLNDKTILHFDAVDYLCTVKVNGKLIGTHRGGYLPFEFDVTDVIKAGNNTIELSVTDPSDTDDQARGKQSLAPGGIWYTPSSGIWGPVWMESVSEDYIKGLKIVPDIDKDEVKVTVDSTAKDVEVTVKDGKKVLAKQNGTGTFTIPMKNYTCWSPENPKLYDLVVKTDGDTVKSYFGMRKYSMGKDKSGKMRLMLNNKPYFHNGVLDQGYWSDGQLTAPTDQAMIDDIQMLKDMGFNMDRKHIKIEPMRWYYYADKLGLIVWQDMVSGGHDYSIMNIGGYAMFGVSPKDDESNYDLYRRTGQQGRDEFIRDTKDTVNLLQNVTSIGMWVPFNEAWGQFDSDKVSEMIYELDPTRTIDRTSGWNAQGGSDFVSDHTYFTPITVPETDKCYVLSEFGGYLLPVSGHDASKTFFGYRVYFTKKDLQNAYKKTFETKIIPGIKQGLSATVWTQLSDVETEINGLVTYDRQVVKMDPSFIKAVNDRCVIPE